MDGELVNLPVTLSDGDVSVYKNGWFAEVRTKFGLKVRFNWVHAVFVTLPNTYMNAVCGLCGDYNGKPGNDLIPKNGNESVSPAKFGESWRVAEVPGCVDDCEGVCPVCDHNDKVTYGTDQYCGILKNTNGPFRDCHAKVDPAGFFEDCVYDTCLYKGRKDILCQAIAAYASACQAVGAEVYQWRTAEFCGKSCIDTNIHE